MPMSAASVAAEDDASMASGSGGDGSDGSVNGGVEGSDNEWVEGENGDEWEDDDEWIEGAVKEVHTWPKPFAEVFAPAPPLQTPPHSPQRSPPQSPLPEYEHKHDDVDPPAVDHLPFDCSATAASRFDKLDPELQATIMHFVRIILWHQGCD